MKKYLIISCLVLAMLSAWLAYSLYKSGSENRRLQYNQEVLMTGIQSYVTKAGKSAASVQKLQLTKDELEKNNQALTQEVKELGIKVKRLQSVAQTATTGKLEIQTDVKDSIVYKPEIHLVDTLKTFSWNDPPWVYVSGIIDSGKVNLSVNTTDTLIQVVHRVPKRFLCFRFGTKAIRQEIVSKNPHTHIIYSEYIEITK